MTELVLNTDRDRKGELLDHMSKLIKQDDLDGALETLLQMELCAETLDVIKCTYGMDLIRNRGIDTSKAVAKYGQQWLEI
jgi:hypothetical protein